MSERDRDGSVVAGLVAAVCVVLVVWGFASVLGKQREYASEYKEAATYQAEDRAELLGECNGLAEAALDRCLAESQRANREDRQRRYDLRAQQDMAQIAFGGLLVAIVVAIFTGAGVFYVARTLSESRRATTAALNAEKSSSETLRLAQLQTMAAVFPQKTLIDFPLYGKSGHTQIEFEFRNRGPTVAESFSCDLELAVIWKDGTREALKVETDGPNQHEIDETSAFCLWKTHANPFAKFKGEPVNQEVGKLEAIVTYSFVTLGQRVECVQVFEGKCLTMTDGITTISLRPSAALQRKATS